MKKKRKMQVNGVVHKLCIACVVSASGECLTYSTRLFIIIFYSLPSTDSYRCYIDVANLIWKKKRKPCSCAYEEIYVLHTKKTRNGKKQHKRFHSGKQNLCTKDTAGNEWITCVHWTTAVIVCVCECVRLQYIEHQTQFVFNSMIISFGRVTVLWTLSAQVVCCPSIRLRGVHKIQLINTQHKYYMEILHM